MRNYSVDEIPTKDRFHLNSVPFIRPAMRACKFEQDKKIIDFGWGSLFLIDLSKCSFGFQDLI
jgi:hypothetical protein